MASAAVYPSFTSATRTISLNSVLLGSMAYVSSSTLVSQGALLLALGGVTGRLGGEPCSITQWIGLDLPATKT